MIYKILNGFVKIPPNTLSRVSTTRPTRKCNEVKVGHVNELVVPESKLNTPSETFYFSAPRLWNTIVSPLQAVAPSTDAFKNHFVR